MYFYRRFKGDIFKTKSRILFFNLGHTVHISHTTYLHADLLHSGQICTIQIVL